MNMNGSVLRRRIAAVVGVMAAVLLSPAVSAANAAPAPAGLVVPAESCASSTGPNVSITDVGVDSVVTPQACVPGSAVAAVTYYNQVLTMQGIASGWARGTLHVSWEVRADGVLLSTGSQTCTTSTSCLGKAYTYYCPGPGMWTLSVTASGPGGRDTDYAFALVV